MPISRGGGTATAAGGGLALAAQHPNFHQVVFRRQREGGGRGWGLVWGGGAAVFYFAL